MDREREEDKWRGRRAKNGQEKGEDEMRKGGERQGGVLGVRQGKSHIREGTAGRKEKPQEFGIRSGGEFHPSPLPSLPSVFLLLSFHLTSQSFAEGRPKHYALLELFVGRE